MPPTSSARLVLAGLIVGAVLASATGLPASALPDGTVVSYAEDPGIIANPGRGWYHHTETHSFSDGSGWTPLDPGELIRMRGEGVTQVLRVVYLERYVDADLDAVVLSALESDFATARAAGVSVILRFAYVQGGDGPYDPPYGDAPPERVLAHISQLTPVLRRNADVIEVVQQGFIGLWGEGYFTDHFVADPAEPGTVTDADWAERNRVVAALLAALPPDRMLQVRTMLAKQRALGTPSGTAGALADAQAYDGSEAARIGHHDDCFLASPDDFGTFLSDPLSLDQDYLAQDSRFVPTGGETCAVNAPRSLWPSARAELQRYHYSFLNRDYDADVLASWGPDGIDEAARRLGYRFVLESSRVVDGAEASVSITLRNDGWAAPYNPRPVQLALTGAGGSVVVPLDVDARTWAPGREIELTVPLRGVDPGQYRVSLFLPAPEASIAGDPRFAIRAANLGTWDAATGRNDLGQVVRVDSPVPPPSGSSDPSVPAPPRGTEPAVVTPIASSTPTSAVPNGSARGRLPATGAEPSLPAVIAALALLLAGGVLRVAARHRRRAD
ncbi:DUF4832 domain-containing protein [Microbacterium sp. NPDC090007]|uniref:DUF4832 domain-containing protein n=1 Tax=Microbacterium sp. NPDC090007 TaxID=3364204 RepID=UPI0038005A24